MCLSYRMRWGLGKFRGKREKQNVDKLVDKRRENVDREKWVKVGF